MAGTLFVVATPIGNLEDLTFRALRTLREVDVIAAEDTRRTRKLLTHYGVSKPLLSLHEHNEYREAPRLVERMARGESIALVSDAGTPGISDPGATVVRLARQAGIVVTPIPGPSAITAALSVSGLALDGFVFMGFPPASGEARGEWMREAANEERCVVFFEAPHRMRRTMEELSSLVTRQIMTHSEITKKFERSVTWPISINAGTDSGPESEAIGEYVVVIEAVDSSVPEGAQLVTRLERASAIFGVLTNSDGISNEEAIVAASAACSVQPAKFRRWLKKVRYSSQAGREAT